MATTESVAIVTGANQGIGQATELRLARDFSTVVLVAREKGKLEKPLLPNFVKFSTRARSCGAPSDRQECAA